jgi:MerR family mercuric resistance operon transcriptional regulator
MENTVESLTIGAFAKAAGVNVETIRFYQRKGLLPEPDKPYGSIRRYGEADVARVKFVKSAQRLGFSLDEVAGLLRLDDGAHCDEARARRAEARGCAGETRGSAADRVGVGAAGSRLLCEPRDGFLSADRFAAGEKELR